MADKPLVLAVDDEKDFLEIASVYLESSGFRTAVLETIEEAEFLRHCEQLQPDLALVDVYAKAEPVGLELAAALGRNPKTAHIQVMLWSSAPKPFEWQAEYFFNKGEDLKVLVEKIRRHVSKNKR